LAQNLAQRHTLALQTKNRQLKFGTFNNPRWANGRHTEKSKNGHISGIIGNSLTNRQQI